MTPPVGYDMAFGTYEDALAMVGVRGDGERWLVDLHVDVLNQRGELCVPADVTLDVSKAVQP